jgi:hypothetical protein
MKNKMTLLSTLIFATMSLALYAEDTKFAGNAMSMKSEAKQADKYHLAIKVKNADGKEETLHVENNQVAKDFLKSIGKETKAVNGEGAISEKDGKKTLTLTKIYLSK